jgi:hypothetical protein
MTVIAVTEIAVPSTQHLMHHPLNKLSWHVTDFVAGAQVIALTEPFFTALRVTANYSLSAVSLVNKSVAV